MFRILILILSYLCSSFLWASHFTAGQDYEILSQKKSESNQTIPVVEFFSYGCPWCYKIENALNNWVLVQGNKISFHRIPVIFNQDWVYYAKAYYIAEALSLNSKLNPVFFDSILNKKESLTSNEALIAFFRERGSRP